MKITMLSIFDAAASGLRLCEAINENTGHEIKLFQWKTGPFGHPHSEIVREKNYRSIQREIDRSDVIHIKGDRPWKAIYPGLKHYMNLKISHKPIVLTLSGTLTRDVRFGGYGQCSRDSYPVDLITAHEPDLKHEWVDILTYYPIRRAETTWRRGHEPTLLHVPSNRITKNTEFVLGIVDKLKKNVNFELLENVNYKDVLEAKKRATIYFDQFVIGWYGNSGVEAMNYGVPVVSWISDFSRKFINPPIISSTGAKQYAEIIDRVLDNDLSELSKTTKEYCDKNHSYESVAKQWNSIYEQLKR